MRARMVTACFAEENQYLESEIRAIIQYMQRDYPANILGRKSEATLPNIKDWSDVVELV